MQKLEINANEIVWEEKDKEIIIDNKLFDVKAISYKNDKAIITGWFDVEEDGVNQAINKNHKRSNKETRITSSFNYVFFEQISIFQIQQQLIITGKKYYSKNESIQDLPHQIFLPPPEQLV